MHQKNKTNQQLTKAKKNRWLIHVLPLTLLVLIGFTSYVDLTTSPKIAAQSKNEFISKSANSSKKSANSKQSKRKQAVADSTPQIPENELLGKLIEYTNAKSPGPTKNYYWQNGTANLSGFEQLKPGEFKFESDTQDRSATARAILTYQQYKKSKGKRQGEPVDPPNWVKHNPKVAITYSLTGKTYHGYQYNRSHSITDSLLGKDSYSSKYNFTTGTRSQNVGANQDGGMRFAEEAAEQYWEKHRNTHETISYQTTPIYNENETIPRGSKVDMKSSDDVLNLEVIVINSAEGLDVDYHASQPIAAPAQVSSEPPVQAVPEQVAPPVQEAPQPVAPPTDYTSSGNWSVAAPGMVFISNSNKYYRQVINPGNYRYVTQDEAIATGAVQGHGNGSAKP